VAHPIFACICLALFLVFQPLELRAAQTLAVAATRTNIDLYTIFMKGRAASEVSSFATPPASRVVVDMVLIQMALAAAGMQDVRLSFHEVANSAQEQAEVKAGNAVICAQDHWYFDFDESVYMTDPIVTEGSFEKGVYVLDSNSSLQRVRSRRELQNYRAVTLGAWLGDVAILEAMGVKDLRLVPVYANIFESLLNGSADYSLLEFSSAPDFRLTLSGVTLVPIPGIKVSIPGSRSMMVSRKHPDGQRIFTALNAGLKILRENGTIARALTECGFYQTGTTNWKVINR